MVKIINKDKYDPHFQSIIKHVNEKFNSGNYKIKSITEKYFQGKISTSELSVYDNKIIYVTSGFSLSSDITTVTGTLRFCQIMDENNSESMRLSNVAIIFNSGTLNDLFYGNTVKSKGVYFSRLSETFYDFCSIAYIKIELE